MNTQSNAIRESSLESQGIVPAVFSPIRLFYWSLRRELWENRSIYIAPLAVAGLALLGFLIATMGRAVTLADPARKTAVLTEPAHFAAALILGAAFIVGIFYALDTLHGERRDRSILFWKSMPVSDLTTVLAKASIPIVLLPLLSFAIVVVTQLIMGALSSLVLAGSHLPVGALWSQWAQSTLQLLYHMVTVHIFWYAPIYSWMLLASAWARRATFLWAGLPPLAIGLLEKISFNTTHFAHLLLYRVTGPEAFDLGAPSDMPAHSMMGSLSLVKFLSTPGLWTGLIVAAVFLAAAIRLRRYRGPI